ncbi:hypothetical protein [Nocardia sienata]|uniref:hypothetical protein n=1 Tax=Nocardia sienata TaxID=248552 RepID=UPI000ABDC527|nr:hypothetical protein [Nocardia sienata]
MPASGPTPAHLRGAFVGAASGTVSVAAHAAGGGVVTLGFSATALLLAGCALAGALAFSLRPGHGPVPLMALLALGQTAGHSALATAPEHQHAAAPSAPMLAAHLLAIPVGAILIHTAERALRHAVSRLRKALREHTFRGFSFPHAVAVAESDHRAARRPLLSSGPGTRGPPLLPG